MGKLQHQPNILSYSPRQPVCGFYRHAFCATRMQHISFFLLIEIIELMAKAKSKRAAPTHKTKRHASKNHPKLLLHNVALSEQPHKANTRPKLSYSNIMQNSPASQPTRSDGTARLNLNVRIFH